MDSFFGVLLAVFFAITLGLVLGILIARKFGSKRKQSLFISGHIREILPVSEYACLVYHYTSVVHNVTEKTFLGLGNKKMLYTIDGSVKLGINAKHIRVETAYNNIIVTLPPIVILSHDIYYDTVKVYDEKTALFGKYTAMEHFKIEDEHKRTKEEEIIQNTGLLVLARKSLEQQFSGLFKIINKNNFGLEFIWEEKSRAGLLIHENVEETKNIEPVIDTVKKLEDKSKGIQA